MKVYHGSDTIVDVPLILPPVRALDFGNGFYVTTNIEQAKTWAATVAYRNSSSNSVVNEYEFDFESAENALKIIRFSAADAEWLEFICANRQNRFAGEYDIVIGPVADDKVYRVVVGYENGDIDKSSALKRLKAEKLCDQILFHTSISLKYLKFSGAERTITV